MVSFPALSGAPAARSVESAPTVANRDPSVPRTVVFLCVANSARSQLAEALARRIAPPGTMVLSAGSNPWRVHPMAVRVLDEVGIDISRARSKGIDEIHIERAGLVVTLCAEEVCPVVPGSVRRLHWPLEDPAEAWGEEEMLRRFRETRDLLTEKLGELFGVSPAIGPPRNV